MISTVIAASERTARTIDAIKKPVFVLLSHASMRCGAEGTVVEQEEHYIQIIMVLDLVVME